MCRPPKGALRRQRISSLNLCNDPAHLLKTCLAPAQPLKQTVLKVATLAQQECGHSRGFGGHADAEFCWPSGEVREEEVGWAELRLPQFAQRKIFGDESQRHRRRTANHLLQMRQQPSATSINEIQRFRRYSLDFISEVLLELLHEYREAFDSNQF